jgi:hypothetical protein
MVIGGDRALAASQLSCGETITTDTTLHTDLLNCKNHGIVIGADGITLDLNGHLIDGDATPAAGCDPQTEACDVGVLIRGHDGVTSGAARCASSTTAWWGSPLASGSTTTAFWAFPHRGTTTSTSCSIAPLGA